MCLDILRLITEYQLDTDAYFLVENHRDYIVYYWANEKDTDQSLQHFKRLKELHCGGN